MARVLLIPAGASPADQSWILRDGQPLTWQQVADANACDRIEVSGEPWAQARELDGYGIVADVPLPEPPAPPDPSYVAPELAQQLLALIDSSAAQTIADLRDAAAAAAGVTP